MCDTGTARRIGRGLVALTFAVAAVSLTSPGTANAKRGNGAAIALGIFGGALAGAAIASAAPQAYAAPPGYYYPYPPPAYVTVPAPAYYYAPPPAAYYAPAPYYGSVYVPYRSYGDWGALWYPYAEWREPHGGWGNP
jgi:hypothetical protein